MRKNFSILRSLIEGLKRDSLGLFLLVVVLLLMTATMCKLYANEHKEKIKADNYIFYLETSLFPEQVECLKQSQAYKIYYDF